MKRDTLAQYRAWLENEVIPGFERSNQPDSWKAESIKRTRQQMADIDYQLSAGTPAPTCGWKKPYAEHPWPCPKHDKYCDAQMGIKRPPKRQKTSTTE